MPTSDLPLGVDGASVLDALAVDGVDLPEPSVGFGVGVLDADFGLHAFLASGCVAGDGEEDQFGHGSLPRGSVSDRVMWTFIWTNREAEDVVAASTYFLVATAPIVDRVSGPRVGPPLARWVIRSHPL